MQHRDLLKAVFCAVVAVSAAVPICAAARVDVHPQCFEPGGWSLDPQFMDVMGSPYLLAHGLGVRVMDATARVVLTQEATPPKGALSPEAQPVAETVKADFVVVGGGLPGTCAAVAAAMCRELGETPRGIYAHGHVRKLQGRLGGEFPGVPDPKLADWRIVDDESKGVKFGKGWQKRHVHYGDQVGEYAHFPGKKAEDVIYPLPVEKAGRYALMGRVPFSYGAKPGSKTVCELTSGGRVKTFTIDQAIADGTWRKLGEFELAPGATLKLLPAKSKGYVVADGFAVVPAGCLRTGVSTIKNTNQL